MKNKNMAVFLFFAMVLLSSVFYASFVFANDISTLEVDVIAGGDTPNDIISVQVPEIDFGEVVDGDKSTELKIWINNTGNVDITVTPRLVDSSEDIFSYLYFRKTKTRTVNGTSVDVPYVRVGDFSFNITKPATGYNYNDEYFYAIVDLTDYLQTISSDILNHQTDLKFYAVAR